jgi:hypothetical protein
MDPLEAVVDPEDPEDFPDAALPDDTREPYPDWTAENSFVIAGPLANHPARTPSEESRRKPGVAVARAWALKKYGQLFEGGRNLELVGSGRYAFRVRRPAKQEDACSE